MANATTSTGLKIILPFVLAVTAFLTCDCSLTSAAVSPFSSGFQDDGQQQVTYSFQFSGVEKPGSGIEITGVTPGGPLTKLRYSSAPNLGDQTLVRGDRIVAINDVSTTNLAQYRRQMDTLGRTNGRARLLVRKTNGYYYSFTVQATASTPPAPPENDGEEEGEGGESEPVDTPRRRDLNPAVKARQIHFLICGQSGTTHKRFNESIDTSLDDMSDLINTVDFQFVGSVEFVRECTAARLREAIRDLDAGPEDTIFFYYTGHGQRDRNNNHVFSLRQTGGYDVMRSEVETALKGKNARLTVMISDSCNVYPTDPFLGGLQSYHSVLPNVEKTDLTGFEKLLLNYRGVVNLNSSDIDQRGWGNSAMGGFYTDALIAGLQSPSGAGGNRRSASQEPSWRHTLTSVAASADAEFKAQRRKAIHSGNCPQTMRQQSAMTPREFEFSVSTDVYDFSYPRR